MLFHTCSAVRSPLRPTPCAIEKYFCFTIFEKTRPSRSPTPTLSTKLLESINAKSRTKNMICSSSHPSRGIFLCLHENAAVQVNTITVFVILEKTAVQKKRQKTMSTHMIHGRGKRGNSGAIACDRRVVTRPSRFLRASSACDACASGCTSVYT